MANNNPFMTGTAASAPMPGPGGAAAQASSDEFAVDLTEVESSGLMPEGTYRVRCANVEQSVSKGGFWSSDKLTGSQPTAPESATATSFWSNGDRLVTNLGVRRERRAGASTSRSHRDFSNVSNSFRCDGAFLELTCAC